jgi:hypothetical protein
MIEYLFRPKFSGTQVVLSGITSHLFLRGDVIPALTVCVIGAVFVAVMNGLVAEYDKQQPNRETP